MGESGPCCLLVPEISVPNRFDPEFNVEQRAENSAKSDVSGACFLKKVPKYVRKRTPGVSRLTGNDNVNSIQFTRLFNVACLLILGCCLMPANTRGLELPITLEYEKGVSLSYGPLSHLYPSAVTYDGVGREICVTESRGRAFHIINEWGVEVFRTGRFADLRGPLEGSLSPDGSLFCIDLNRDTRGSSISKLNLYGEPMSFEAEVPIRGWSPDHLVFAADGNLLSLDGTARILALHDVESGSLIWQQEIMDEEAADLGFGRPFCAPDGRIFLPGGESHQVHVYSADGAFLSSFGRFGTGPAGMVFPIGVAFGPNGSILVLDRMRHKILVFDSAYEYVTEVGRAGIYPGQFYHPLSIAALEDGRVYVSQGFQSRVQIFQLLFEGLN
jgi:DNA-binding beta-propeller fold protein YncE